MFKMVLMNEPYLSLMPILSPVPSQFTGRDPNWEGTGERMGMRLALSFLSSVIIYRKILSEGGAARSFLRLFYFVDAEQQGRWPYALISDGPTAHIQCTPPLSPT